MRFFLSIAIFIALFMCGTSTGISYGQDMSGSVVKHRIRFAKGKSSATLSGKAKYAMSYVYDLGAQKDQTMNIHLTSPHNIVQFSLIRPDQETMEKGFLVTDWQGKLPQKGDYSIVLVMNDAKAKLIEYTLTVEVK